ncbi:MAG: 16S rRNA (cytidine(1402)-2'-O)-methyltransferase [Lysobacterales bacterium]|jgi:16S rRNA (cytidine1402-2'-O)-methyltransferase
MEARGRLYVVATPIGNLDDLTLRARSVLAEADVVAAEDTRHTRNLLARHGLDRPLVSLHEHNEDTQSANLVGRLEAGESVALVSDAGTPLISDPGYRLVRRAAEAGIEVVAVPGPSAVTAALSVSGLATDRFAFEGFLPSRSSARRKALTALQAESRTLVFFESSHRIRDCLEDLCDLFGPERPAAICRELTKQFETVLRGTLAELSRRVAEDADQRKGEFVLVVAGASTETAVGMAAALELARALQEHVGLSQAARIAAKFHGVSRRDVYERLNSARPGSGDPGVRGGPGSE